MSSNMLKFEGKPNKKGYSCSYNIIITSFFKKYGKIRSISQHWLNFKFKAVFQTSCSGTNDVSFVASTCDFEETPSRLYNYIGREKDFSLSVKYILSVFYIFDVASFSRKRSRQISIYMVVRTFCP